MSKANEVIKATKSTPGVLNWILEAECTYLGVLLRAVPTQPNLFSVAAPLANIKQQLPTISTLCYTPICQICATIARVRADSRAKWFKTIRQRSDI